MLLLQICHAQREREAKEPPEKQKITITCPVLSAKFDKLWPQILISSSWRLRGATGAEIMTLRGRTQRGFRGAGGNTPPPPPSSLSAFQ